MIGLRTYLRSFLEDYRAWKRGEVRVLPRGCTGRIYARKSEQVSAAIYTQTGAKVIKARPKAKLERLRVWRDAEQRWEEIPLNRSK